MFEADDNLCGILHFIKKVPIRIVVASREDNVRLNIFITLRTKHLNGE